MLTVYIALFVTVLDQLVKWIVQQHMVWGESITLISGVFHLTYIINPGAAFGILAYQRWFFLAIVILLFGAFFFFRKRIPESPAIFPPRSVCCSEGLWEMPSTACVSAASWTSSTSASGRSSMWQTFSSVSVWH